MIQLVVHAFMKSNRETAVVEIVFASSDKTAVQAVYADYQDHFPDDYVAIYDVPLDTDLTKLDHYPSVAIGKEEFGG